MKAKKQTKKEKLSAQAKLKQARYSWGCRQHRFSDQEKLRMKELLSTTTKHPSRSLDDALSLIPEDETVEPTTPPLPDFLRASGQDELLTAVVDYELLRGLIFTWKDPGIEGTDWSPYD